MAAVDDHGIVTRRSADSVDRTVETLEAVLRMKGIALFAVIDHSGQAASVGLQMQPTKLLIFGNPKAGTPLMLAAPTCALDLPLKLLVWEDAQGDVWISYNSAEYLHQRHGVPQELLHNIDVMDMLVLKAAEASR